MAALAKTQRFKVWSSPEPDSLQTKKSPSARNAASVVMVGGRKVTVSDVARVAILNYSVTLDVATIEKIDQDLASSKDLLQICIPELKAVAFNDSVVYDVSFCRAVIFARIVSLMQCRSAVRSVIIELLVELLEANIVPNFSSPDMAGLELCAFLTAVGGSCYMDGVIMHCESAFEMSGLTPVGLTSFELSTLKLGQFWSTGCTCLIAAGAANMAGMMDCISALSCDTFGASVEPFDATNFDTCRQHRGQIASATNLRLLLEGSKRTNSSSIESAFGSVPQINGPSQESVSSSVKYVTILVLSIGFPMNEITNLIFCNVLQNFCRLHYFLHLFFLYVSVADLIF